MVILKYIRYILLFLIGAILIWSILIFALHFNNKYVGTLTIIFPSSHSDTRLKLFSVGEMSTNTKSIFSNMKIDPKETYKEIIMSERLKNSVAIELDLPISKIPTPIIKNVPQTPLIKITIKSDNEKNIIDILDSFIRNLKKQIENYRIEYINFRTEINDKQITESKKKIDIISSQINQIRLDYNLVFKKYDEYYSEQMSTIDDEMRKNSIQLISFKTQLEEFEKMLNISAEEASTALLINSDYTLNKLHKNRAEIIKDISTLSAISGKNNPDLKILIKKYHKITENINTELFTLEKSLNVQNTKKFILNPDMDERAEIFKLYVLNKIKYHALIEENHALKSEFDLLSEKFQNAIEKDVELQMLNKKLLLEEAIYFSKLSNIQVYSEDAESIYPNIQLWERSKITRRKNNFILMVIIISGNVSTILWFIILCLYFRKHHSRT